MNISFFLKPKIEVSYLFDDCPVRQALDDMMKSGFTAIPVIDHNGRYIGTIGEGDFLRLLLRKTPEQLEKMTVGEVERRVRHRSVSIDAKMEDMVDLVTAQNFVPVADGRGMFIGIVTRHDVIKHLRDTCEGGKKLTEGEHNGKIRRRRRRVCRGGAAFAAADGPPAVFCRRRGRSGGSFGGGGFHGGFGGFRTGPVIIHNSRRYYGGGGRAAERRRTRYDGAGRRDRRAAVYRCSAGLRAVIPSGGGVAKSTVEREKLPASAVQETGYYTDEGGWFGNANRLEAGMKQFYRETGVQPYLYLLPNGAVTSVSELTEKAEELYPQLFQDEGHFLLVFCDDGHGSYNCGYTAGSMAKSVMDDEAVGILADYLDRYYSDYSISEEEIFSNAFAKTGERIMTVTRSPVVPVAVCARRGGRGGFWCS